MKRAPLVVLLMASAESGCTEFPNEPPATVTVEQATSWPTEMFVRDTDTVAIRVTLQNSTTVSGLRVNWQSSDQQVLEVTEVQSSQDTRDSSLTAQLAAVVITHARGAALVTAAVEGDGPFKAIDYAGTIVVEERWISVSAGFDHTCGLTIDHDAYCWGTPAGGLGLGNGRTTGSLIPVSVFGGLKFSNVSAGRDHSCGLVLGSGLAYCWGFNRYGAVGNNSQFDQLTPVQVSFGRTFKSISAGLFYTCGVTHTNAAHCWGFHRLGQLGDFAPPAQRPIPDPVLSDCDGDGSRCALTPVPVRTTTFAPSALEFLEAVAGQLWFTCGIEADSTAACWGLVPFVVAGDFDNPPDCSPDPRQCIVAVPGGHRLKVISTGFDHACGITTAGSLLCWGRNNSGQVGSGVISPGDPIPVEVSGGRHYETVSAGTEFTCAITMEAIPYCWGKNNVGQLGGGTSASAVPVPVSGGLHFVHLGTGAEHACGVTPEGAAYCWGQNARGQLGDGSTTPRPTPERVKEPG
jgi:alpha-tubulin suppressor-like RCC1 family protein